MRIDWRIIRHELRNHAPFTGAGALSGIVIMLVLSGAGSSRELTTRLFWLFHPAHVLLSAMVTSAMFRLHGGRGLWRILWVGYVGSVGIATLSDSVIPFWGEWMLQWPHRGLHFGFIEKWWLVNPLALGGIALGAAGSDVAIHSASVALMNNDLRRLPFLIRLSRMARTVVFQNIAVGGLFIIGGLFLSGLGKLNPIVATLLHNAGSLIVVFNSARLIRAGEDLEARDLPNKP